MTHRLSVLEQYFQLRARQIDTLTGDVAAQRQLCQRLENNIQNLTALADASPQTDEASALWMNNQSAYKQALHRIINWQKQTHALANMEAGKLQQQLLQQSRQQKGLETVIQGQQKAQETEQQRKEQRSTDAISTQIWLRQRHR